MQFVVCISHNILRTITQHGWIMVRSFLEFPNNVSYKRFDFFVYTMLILIKFPVRSKGIELWKLNK